MTVTDSFKNLNASLKNGIGFDFVEEVSNKIENEDGLYNEVGLMPKQHVHDIYKLRYDISKQNKTSDVEGFQFLLNRIEKSVSTDIFVSTLTFSSGKYFVFYGTNNNEFIGILKLNKTNLEKTYENDKLFEAKGIKPTNISFSKGKLVV